MLHHIQIIKECGMRLIIFVTLFSFTLFCFVLCRPHLQKFVIHGHEWTVPNEPGWESVLEEADPIRRNHLRNCNSIKECRNAAELMRKVFLKYPVSKKYYDESDDVADTIFKWG
ncbi:unnamed protein product [Didymodactylos carnosus]|uniref:Uncharacterized protein n=1 Tax=Didymodactylos carnosus TaxID=1234261 RepID=A0A814GM30_9BILA|nr:unnamed protein product [Didymodactylos carnosus]CAF1221843.1 unnamed protein product [Didymodactylos carnosus]CAF3769971.1 unnamed protein product [Didymodactylos carnosus]CAF4029968.1 unnamed protein product [Didymodactylos carnosus]